MKARILSRAPRWTIAAGYTRRMNAVIDPAAPAVGNDDFANRLLAWFDQHGRSGLPWQHPRSAYRVWLSEVMLQQTQVATVIPYFERFVARFPDFRTLAAASIDEVLQLWAGLGYYARGRNLHRAAQRVVAEHCGEMPRDFEAVLALPGVGRSTAAAILAQAYGERHAILDGNVKRVLARHAAIEGWPGSPIVAARLWQRSEALLPQTRLADYTQALMDLGATLCTTRRPACERCPVAADCEAHRLGRISEFPESKPRRARPQRRAQLLLVERSDGSLLLERRPSAGIWGGLWCPPVIGSGESAETVLLDRYGFRAAVIKTWPAVHHAFTHFDLELLPVGLAVEAASVREAEQVDQRWTTIAATATLGLPAPVRRFFDQIDPARP
jgi:A/G-specific adenine glycosylase